jgi:benzoyl-CoA reductase/2-hydroxyglutaryl-CoA dehydratase subunit BcrC/BadD/HgdB
MTRNKQRLHTLRTLVKEYRPQCVIELVWHACLTYDIEAYYVKNFVEQEFGLPYLHLETDYSRSDDGRIALRVQALVEMVRGAMS